MTFTLTLLLNWRLENIYCVPKNNNNRVLIAALALTHKGTLLFINEIFETDSAEFNKIRVMGGRQHC